MRFSGLDKDVLKKGLYVDARLRRWGLWYNRLLESGLGYCKSSTIAQLRDDGGILSRSTAPTQVLSDPEAEQVDAQIAALSAYNPILSRVLKLHYAENLSYDDIKIKYHLSKTTFKSHLHTARAFIAAKITQ